VDARKKTQAMDVCIGNAVIILREHAGINGVASKYVESLAEHYTCGL